MNAVFTQIITRPDNLQPCILEVDLASDGSMTITAKIGGTESVSITLLDGESEILRTMLRYAASIDTPTSWDIGEVE
jgi:hypothetical protein